MKRMSRSKVANVVMCVAEIANVGKYQWIVLPQSRIRMQLSF